jgi:HPt (histidine-containing phosphotransfer) domain-containing protein
MGDDEVLDRTAFDDFAGLFDAAELRDVIEEWHADSLKALDAISAARARGDRVQIGELAHRAAGGAQALGATALASACERLRALADSGDDVDEGAVLAVRDAVHATHAAMDAAARQQGTA